jgi:hypothetical protein
LISDDSFQPTILVFERAHLCHVADLHTAKLGFPGIKGYGTYAVSLADLFGRFAGFVLFENADDPRLASSR